MKQTKKLIVLAGVLFACSIFAQEKLLVNKWIICECENKKNTNKQDAVTEFESITFYSNHTFQELDGENLIPGNWKYLPAKKTVVLTSFDFPIKINLKIIKLNDLEFVFESKNDVGLKVIVCMKKYFK
jgi:hypothetical protein